jgi:hypothetical protein
MALGYVQLALRDFAAAKAAFARAVALDPKLEPLLEPAAAAIPIAESEWQRFEDPNARTPGMWAAWARHLARVGRSPEADAAYLAMATSEVASNAERTEAVRYLVLDGSVPHAEEAARSWPAGLADPGLARELEARRARRQAVVELEARIAAMMVRVHSALPM